MSKCKQCGLPVQWVNLGTEKRPTWKCHNPDGSDHWDLCSKTRFERVKREGTYFESEDREGKNEVHGYCAPHKTQLVMIRPLKPMKGKRYKPDTCRCGLPPWELCKPTCPSAIHPAT